MNRGYHRHEARAMKPENALKRAEDLLAVQQTQQAFETLYDFMAMKRTYRTWSPAYDALMMKLIDLGVLSRRNKAIKDALIQFKNIAITSGAIDSIETLVKHWLVSAEKKVAVAQAKMLDQVEDLDQSLDDRPEQLMLRTVSAQDDRDRADREILMPWFKFLWESYRSILDALRNNTRLETLYKTVANQAFQFCLKYNRKTELRRLCDLLRNHLTSLAKYASQPFAIDLNVPESMQMHLETRFVQLNAATQLGLWQEAFRSVQDLYNLMKQSRKAPKLHMLMNYYDKMSCIFQMSEDSLFHAAATLKYYHVASQSGAMSEEELNGLATKLVLAILSVPMSASEADMDDFRQARAQELSALLHMSQVPTRSGLLKEIHYRGLLKRSSVSARSLFDSLEIDFHPLSITKKVEPVMAELAKSESHGQYVKSLYRVILTRLLQQLSTVYSVVRLDTLQKLTTFPAPYSLTAFDLEKFLLQGNHRGDFRVKINHRDRTVMFESSVDAMAANNLEASLSNVASRLSKALTRLPDYKPETTYKAHLEELKKTIEEEHKEALARKDFIERKKEYLEAAAQRREKEEAMERAIRMQHEAEAEKVRLAEEAKKRELDRMKREREEIERQQAMKIAEELKKKDVNIDVEAIEKLDKEKLLKLQVETLESQKAKVKTKLAGIAKRLDHTERAFRKEEVPLLEEAHKKQMEDDRKAHDEAHRMLLEATERQHQMDVEARNRLKNMVSEVASFKKQINQNRLAAVEKLRAEMDAKKAAAKEQRIAEFKQKKMEEMARKRQEELERQKRAEEEAKQREREEKERAEREAKEAVRREQLLKEKEEREKQMHAATEQARRQLEREQQAEENRRKREEERLAATRPQRSEEQMDWTTVRRKEAAPPAASAAATGGKYVPPRLRGDQPTPAATPGKFVPPAMRNAANGSSGDGAAGAKAYVPPSARGAAADTTTPSASPAPGKYIPPGSRTEEAPKKFVPPHRRGEQQGDSGAWRK